VEFIELSSRYELTLNSTKMPENHQIDQRLNGQTQTLQKNVEEHLRNYFAAHTGGALPPSGLYYRILPLIEKPLIEMTLRATEGNQLKAAYVLGINRNTLRKKISELGIEITEG
jgi:two-component system nitrogen regulation response regulator GlnG